MITIVCKIFESDSHFDLCQIIGTQTAWNKGQYVVMKHLRKLHNVHTDEWKA